MKSQNLIITLLLMLPGAAFAADFVTVPEPNVLMLIVAGVAVVALVSRNRRK
jgi:hypothetical protein